VGEEVSVSESEGVVSNLFGSIQSHVSDRLKSPFAGAFVISWVVHNWRELLILLFSGETIENRILAIAPVVTNLKNILFVPIAYAFIGILGYYVVSIGFLVVFEFYGLARRAVERKFDAFRWVHPDSYLAFKKTSNEKIVELTELASDRIEKIDELKQNGSRLEADLLALQAELSEERLKNASLVRTNEILKSDSARLSELMRALSTQLDTAKEQFSSLRSDFSEIFERHKNVVRVLDSVLLELAREVDPDGLGRMSSAVFVSLSLVAGKEKDLSEEKYNLLMRMSEIRTRILDALEMYERPVKIVQSP
jgi:hypothetical protein